MSRDLYPVLSPEKYYQPEKWTALHRFMVLLELSGKKPREIAEITDTSLGRVSVILGDKRAEIERAELGSKIADQLTDVHSKLKLYAHEALEIIVEEMREITNKPEIRVKAGFGVLDRAGFTPVQKQVVARTEIPMEVAQRIENVTEELKQNRTEYKKVTPKLAEGEREVMEDD